MVGPDGLDRYDYTDVATTMDIETAQGMLSDKPTGPIAGSENTGALEFLAKLNAVSRICQKGSCSTVMTVAPQ